VSDAASLFLEERFYFSCLKKEFHKISLPRNTALRLWLRLTQKYSPQTTVFPPSPHKPSRISLREVKSEVGELNPL